MPLKEGMEYCSPQKSNVYRPQYLVKSVHNHHIVELMDVDTKKVFPIWQHPKLSQYQEQIIDFGLAPYKWEDGDNVIWINTLVFDVSPYNTIIDVHGAWNEGIRYSGILHLDEDWQCLYPTAANLGLFN